MRSRILFASVVGIGSGSESTEGGRDESGELGREDGRFDRRLLAPPFLSLDGPLLPGGMKSMDLYDSTGDCRLAILMSSVTGRDVAEENDPSLFRNSVAGASC